MTRPRHVVVLLGLLLVALASVAAANPTTAKRKKTPDRFAKAASEAFVAATEADEKGDLPAALGLYQKAFQISPHPSTIYNIADVQRRLGKLTDAIMAYETYLAIAPSASDRRDVAAVIDRLARTPGTIYVTTTGDADPKSVDLASGYILVDGRLELRPGKEPTMIADTRLFGLEIKAAGGLHVIDVVTPLTYAQTTCAVRPGERSICTVTAPPRTDGNVVVSGLERQVTVRVDHTDHRNDSRMSTRFARPPGRTRLLVRDGTHECPQLVLEAPRGHHVAYAFLATTEPSTYARCRAFDIQRHELRFAP